MKTINLKVKISNKQDMNDLVDLVCSKLNKDTAFIKDKFKMVSQADLKKVLDMCKFFKLKFIFDPEGGNSITIVIPEKMIVVKEIEEVIEQKEDAPKEEAPVVVDDFVSVNETDTEDSDQPADDDEPF